MSETVDGTDYSWLAIDANDRLGWFCINGSGPIPPPLTAEPELFARQEDALAAWVRAAGRPFEFGAGDSMWRATAAVGVFAFDFDDRAQNYRLICKPDTPVVVAHAPSRIVDALTVRLPRSDFPQGVVSRAEVAGALLL